ncbi:MAG: DUF2271 domain-containing protein [Akkermansiaceae bacterium]
MKKQHIITLAALASSQAGAHTLEINVPQIDVSEYHKPYIAAWVESPDKATIKNILVWYQINKDTKKGEEWLKDMRKWWRSSGRKLDFPIDGVTSPTRPPGKHTVDITEDITELQQGEYTLYVEAAREVGGRELIKIPFKWDGKQLTTETPTIKGTEELGDITLTNTPKQ